MITRPGCSVEGWCTCDSNGEIILRNIQPIHARNSCSIAEAATGSGRDASLTYTVLGGDSVCDVTNQGAAVAVHPSTPAALVMFFSLSRTSSICFCRLLQLLSRFGFFSRLPFCLLPILHCALSQLSYVFINLLQDGTSCQLPHPQFYINLACELCLLGCSCRSLAEKWPRAIPKQLLRPMLQTIAPET